jgi:tryptophan 2,3-dioxygenase
MQFREIEFSSGLKDAATLRAFDGDEFAAPRLRARFDAPTLGEAFFAYLSRKGLDAPPDDASLSEDERRRRYGQRTRAALEVLTHFETRYEEYQLSESLIAHDEYFSLWRHHHVKMVERMLGTKKGTGGSEGVGYLRTTLDKKFFPELWEARTHLDSRHGAAGCPFAGHQ